jgi:hypothetical protein
VSRPSGVAARHLRRNAVAYLALAAALGSGTALAASRLAPGSVGTAQLRRNAVVSSKVKDGSLRARDFAPGVLAGTPGSRGEAGPAGPAGPQGEAGPPGEVRAYAYVHGGESPGLDPQRSHGFASVAHAGTGTYCLTPAAGIDPSTATLIVSPVFNNGVLEPEFAEPSPNFACPSTALEVVTYLPGAPIAMTDNLDFTVALP